MIDKNELLKQLDGKTGLWCGADVEGADLAQAIGILTEQGIDNLSVVPGAVATVWPWLEDKNVKIYARFYLSEKRVTEKQISDITVRINNALRQGACGAQIFLRAGALSGLVDQTYVVRDDLFFDKDLSIGLDIADIDANDWDVIFENLRKIKATSVVIVFTNDTGDKSDFVGRIYGMLNAWSAENKFDLHFAFGPNFMRIEQAQRLVQSVQPGLNNRLKFWVNY